MFFPIGQSGEGIAWTHINFFMVSGSNAMQIRYRVIVSGGQFKAAPPVPGKRPYKKAGAGLVPKATKDCTGCGLCAKQCPSRAISPGNIRETDPGKCISCMRCITECPHSARKVNSAMVAAASLIIKRECAVRKECELFV